MALFTDIITIYNYFKADGKDLWNRTVLPNVMWNTKKEKAVSADGKVTMTDTVEITIPFRSGYTKPKQYDGVGWTLNAADNMDVIVLGEVQDEMTEAFTITNLRKKYDDVVTVKSVGDNTNRNILKHWRVGGQ